MKILVNEKLSQHKYKTPEGYLVCVDSVLARTGKQTYRRNEIFMDSNDDSEIEIDRTPEEVFAEATLASFENKPITLEHPDEDVNIDNYKDYSIGFVRDVKRGTYDGQDVILGTLVFTDAEAIKEIEEGTRTELSCGYDCDIEDDDNPRQTHIRGNHVALCEAGRAGIAKIIDSVGDEDTVKYKGYALKFHKGYNAFLNMRDYYEVFDERGNKVAMKKDLKSAKEYVDNGGFKDAIDVDVKDADYVIYNEDHEDVFHCKSMSEAKKKIKELQKFDKQQGNPFDEQYSIEIEDSVEDDYNYDIETNFDKILYDLTANNIDYSSAAYDTQLIWFKDDTEYEKAKKYLDRKRWKYKEGVNKKGVKYFEIKDAIKDKDWTSDSMKDAVEPEAKGQYKGYEVIAKHVDYKTAQTEVDIFDGKRKVKSYFTSEDDLDKAIREVGKYWPEPPLTKANRDFISNYLKMISGFARRKDTDIQDILRPLSGKGFKPVVDKVEGWIWKKGQYAYKNYFIELEGYTDTFLVTLYADPEQDWDTKEVNAYFTDSIKDASNFTTRDLDKLYQARIRSGAVTRKPESISKKVGKSTVGITFEIEYKEKGNVAVPDELIFTVWDSSRWNNGNDDKMFTYRSYKEMTSRYREVIDYANSRLSSLTSDSIIKDAEKFIKEYGGYELYNDRGHIVIKKDGKVIQTADNIKEAEEDIDDMKETNDSTPDEEQTKMLEKDYDNFVEDYKDYCAADIKVGRTLAHRRNGNFTIIERKGNDVIYQLENGKQYRENVMDMVEDLNGGIVKFVDSVEDSKVNDTTIEVGKTYNCKSGAILKVKKLQADISDYDGKASLRIWYDWTSASGKKSGSSTCSERDFFEMLTDKTLTGDSLHDVEPRSGESKDEFISRFMKETKSEYPDMKQRLAVAYSYWKNKGKDSMMKDEYYLDDVIRLFKVGRKFDNGSHILTITKNNGDTISYKLENGKTYRQSAKTMLANFNYNLLKFADSQPKDSIFVMKDSDGNKIVRASSLKDAIKKYKKAYPKGNIYEVEQTDKFDSFFKTIRRK